MIIELIDHRDTVRCLDFSLDGNLQLMSASRDGSLKLWDIPEDGNMYSTFKPYGIVFTCCCFAPNARFIAAVGTCRMVGAAFTCGVFILIGLLRSWDRSSVWSLKRVVKMDVLVLNDENGGQ